MQAEYRSLSHCKFLLRYHIILVCKYRKKLLTKQLSEEIKGLSHEILNKHQVKILFVESDKDHIHYMIETSPMICLSNIIRTLKAYTTFYIRKMHPELSKEFWKENTFWTDGYFVSSVGEVSSETLKNYIQNQG